MEVHQSSPTSSDLGFNLELVGLLANAVPAVDITSPLDNASFNIPISITIDATASDSDDREGNFALRLNATSVPLGLIIDENRGELS